MPVATSSCDNQALPNVHFPVGGSKIVLIERHWLLDPYRSVLYGESFPSASYKSFYCWSEKCEVHTRCGCSIGIRVVGMAKAEKCWRGCGATWIPYTAGRSINWYNCVGKLLGSICLSWTCAYSDPTYSLLSMNATEMFTKTCTKSLLQQYWSYPQIETI